MNEPESNERRTERAAFETETHLVIGDVTLPRAGYQSRFSDMLNRQDIDFISLVNVEINSLADGRVTELPFAAINKNQIRHAYPLRQ